MNSVTPRRFSYTPYANSNTVTTGPTHKSLTIAYGDLILVKREKETVWIAVGSKAFPTSMPNMVEKSKIGCSPILRSLAQQTPRSNARKWRTAVMRLRAVAPTTKAQSIEKEVTPFHPLSCPPNPSPPNPPTPRPRLGSGGGRASFPAPIPFFWIVVDDRTTPTPPPSLRPPPTWCPRAPSL